MPQEVVWQKRSLQGLVLPCEAGAQVGAYNFLSEPVLLLQGIFQQGRIRISPGQGDLQARVSGLRTKVQGGGVVSLPPDTEARLQQKQNRLEGGLECPENCHF